MKLSLKLLTLAFVTPLAHQGFSAPAAGNYDWTTLAGSYINSFGTCQYTKTSTQSPGQNFTPASTDLTIAALHVAVAGAPNDQTLNSLYISTSVPILGEFPTEDSLSKINAPQSTYPTVIGDRPCDVLTHTAIAYSTSVGLYGMRAYSHPDCQNADNVTVKKAESVELSVSSDNIQTVLTLVVEKDLEWGGHVGIACEYMKQQP